MATITRKELTKNQEPVNQSNQTMPDIKLINSTLVRQRDQSDCGVACLASIVKFYGGEVKIEALRELSGTTIHGTTLLGLYQAAGKIGLDAEGYEADIDNLKKLQSPCILHVVIEKRLMHYVVCYGYKNGRFVTGDPGRGIVRYLSEELAEIWQSKALLQLKPNANFIRSGAARNAKRKWLQKLIADDYNLLGISAVLGVFISLFSMATAIFSQKLIDDILPNEHYTKLIVGLSLLAFLLLVRVGVWVIRENLVLRQSVGFNRRVIDLFYSSLLRLPKAFFDNRKTGELIARMNDTVRIQNTLSYIIGNVIIDVLVLSLSLIFIFAYSIPLAMITIAVIPVYFLIIYVLHNDIVGSQREVMMAYARTESNYVDTLQGIGAIKAGNRENFFSEITRAVYGEFQQKIFDLGIVRIRLNMLTETIGTIMIVSIIAVGSFMALNKELRLGELMAILTIAMGMIPSISRLALTNVQLQEARIAFERMYDFATIAPEYDLHLEHQKKSIEHIEMLELQHLSFRFPGRKQLFHDLSLQVGKSEMIALLGENGCGKSTALQMLQKFYLPESGNILVNSQPLDEFSIHSWRRLVGAVPQHIKIFNGTLIDNISMGDTAAEAKRVIAFCNESGFHVYFEQFPQSYMTLLGEEGVNLSGGQQQLVGLARALYHRPQLLLLDEATSAMDRNTELFAFDLLRKLKVNMGIILVTHRIQVAQKADRVYVMENGAISTCGKHDELIRSTNLYSLAFKDLTSFVV